MEIKPIAKIYTDFPEKFGLPRQSGLVPELQGKIVFEKEYQVREALRGLEDFSHLWLLWEFSMSHKSDWSPTVRPPKLGGNTRVGVFATRSPFRPNSIGMSCVKLEKILETADNGLVLIVSGIDMMDGTPIFDIKPYLPYVDSHPEAKGGFTDTLNRDSLELEVEIPPEILEIIPKNKRSALLQTLRQDPRPGYQSDPERVYGLHFAGYEVKFVVTKQHIIVKSISKIK